MPNSFGAFGQYSKGCLFAGVYRWPGSPPQTTFIFLLTYREVLIINIMLTRMSYKDYFSLNKTICQGLL
nr:MAG TPA: hypothetical protein [Caudoviricetes sp.]